MSRHHTLPPIIYTPPPPKTKEAKRKRGVGQLRGKRAIDETEETDEAAHTAPARSAAPPPQHAPIDAAERRLHSPNGHLSDGTLKAMLEMQEQEGREQEGRQAAEAGASPKP